MKIRTYLILTLAIIFFTSAIVSKKTDFNGSWKINAGKSDFGESTPDKAAPGFINIVQTSKSLKLERTFGQSAPTNEYYNFDGKTVDTTMGIYKKSSSLKWSDDEKQFIVSSLYKVAVEGKAPWEYTRTEIYGLSENGKILTLDRVSVLPDRTETVKAVYDKK